MLLFQISKLCPAFMNHLMCNDSSSSNIKFSSFPYFFAMLYENNCFLEEGRHIKYCLEGSIGSHYNWKLPKGYFEHQTLKTDHTTQSHISQNLTEIRVTKSSPSAHLQNLRLIAHAMLDKSCLTYP